MTSPEEVKRRAKQLVGAMMEIREDVLAVPILRKRLIGFTNQARGQRIIKVPLEVDERIRVNQGTYEEVQAQPQVALPFQRPRLLQAQTPVREAVANLINALTMKSTGVRQRQKEDEQMYEERQKDLEESKLAEERLRRKGFFKGYSIEM